MNENAMLYFIQINSCDLSTFSINVSMSMWHSTLSVRKDAEFHSGAGETLETLISK